MTTIPAPLYNAQGEPRKLGVELELAGLDLDQLTDIVQTTLGGTVDRLSDYEIVLRDTAVGQVRIEFDAALFRDLKVRRFVESLDSARWSTSDRDGLEKAFASVAQWVVPFELIFDPLPFGRLPELEVVRRTLSRQALGTASSMLYAFGLHLNPEVPDTRVETILSYLRAFIVLYEQLKQRHGINPSRSLSGFIAPFPRQYALLVLDPRYTPSMERFIDDYLALNPTRNRPLDLLPLLAYLDEARVRSKLPEEKIRRRPAFHYRLPDSRIDESDWSLAREWSIWLQVESLANDPKLLAKRSRYELKRLRGPVRYWLRRAWRTKPLLSRKPMIGVTGPDRGGWLAWACTWLALKRAGAHPVRLRPSMVKYDPSLPPFDGLILGGGADIDPGRYQPAMDMLLAEDEPADESDDTPRSGLFRRLWRLLASLLFVLRRSLSLASSHIDLERDEFEQCCLEKAFREKLPVLGICRGAQLLNVALGGDLHEDVSEFYGEVGRVSTLLPSSKIEVRGGTQLRRVLGRGSVRVNSLNHQAIRGLGQGLRVCAVDSAGVVQAVESVEEPRRLGVQWHPEYLPGSRVQQRLFQDLVAEAAIRKG